MPLALLIALAACIVLGVGWLRCAGERNRLRDEVQEKRTGLIAIHYGADWTWESPRQRQFKAERIVRGAKRKARK